jgi:hypothetical protein
MTAFLPLDWIVDERSWDMHSPARFWRDVDNQALRRITPALTEAIGIVKLGTSPFGSRRGIPGDLISAEAN